MAEKEQQRYRVIEKLAAGGMAEVFIAESAGIEGFKKRVAIKRVLPHLSKKERFIAMFLDEARLSAHLSHSNVAQVFDIGVGDDTYFIVMEYVDGSDLKRIIKHLRETDRRVPIECAVYIATKICEGLAYAHTAVNDDGEPLQAVHRDISPPNVLLSRYGEVKIVDFGLAKASTQLEKSEAGIIKGKFAYLSPEAAHGRDVDARADIFAVGIILWEMLAGRRLFYGKSDYETVKAVQAAVAPPISGINRDADAQLDSILARALAPDREARYQDARALGRDLTRYLYHLGRAVSAFDVAELVRGTIGRSERPRGEGVSKIAQLISDTLLQFTSLADEDADRPPGERRRESKPFFGFDDFARFVDESSGTSNQSELLVKNTLPADVFEEGNLAALEGPEDPIRGAMDSILDFDDEPAPSAADADATDRRPSRERDRTAAEGADVTRVYRPSSPGGVLDDIARAEATRADASAGADGEGAAAESEAGAAAEDSHVRPVVPAPDAGSSTALKAVLLVVIAAGAVAAVWFSGLL